MRVKIKGVPVIRISEITDLAATVAAAREFKITTVRDINGNLNSKYFIMFSALDANVYTVWFNVDSAGSDPNVPFTTSVPVAISSNDSANTIAGLVAEAICDLHLTTNAAIADDGGAFTDETTEATNDTIDDVTLLPAAPAANDAYYIGKNSLFNSVTFNISTAGVGTWTINWEYWDGGSWSALSGVTDETSGYTVVGKNNVHFDIPNDWATTTVNAQGPFYYIRGRVLPFTAITTQPLGARICINEFRSSLTSNIITLVNSTYGGASGPIDGNYAPHFKTNFKFELITVGEIELAIPSNLECVTITGTYDKETLYRDQTNFYTSNSFPTEEFTIIVPNCQIMGFYPD